MSQESENQIANLFQQCQRDINHHLETIAYLKNSVEYLNESLHSERQKTQYLTTLLLNSAENKPPIVYEKKDKTGNKYRLFKKINKEGFKHKKTDMGNIYKGLKHRLHVRDNSLLIQEGDKNVPYEPNQHNS